MNAFEIGARVRVCHLDVDDFDAGYVNAMNGAVGVVEVVGHVTSPTKLYVRFETSVTRPSGLMRGFWFFPSELEAA